MRLFYLGIAAIVANATDLLTTLIALTLKTVVELNGLYYTLGPLGFFLVKIFLPMAAICAGLLLISKYPRNIQLQAFWCVFYICLIAVFAFATINTIGVILHA